jgi:hypothetical protein
MPVLGLNPRASVSHLCAGCSFCIWGIPVITHRHTKASTTPYLARHTSFTKLVHSLRTQNLQLGPTAAQAQFRPPYTRQCQLGLQTQHTNLTLPTTTQSVSDATSPPNLHLSKRPKIPTTAQHQPTCAATHNTQCNGNDCHQTCRYAPTSLTPCTLLLWRRRGIP